jgi:hypothetical protein
LTPPNQTLVIGQAEAPSTPPTNNILERGTDGFTFSRGGGTTQSLDVINSDNIGFSWNLGRDRDGGNDSLLADFPLVAGVSGSALTLGQLWERLPEWESEGKGYVENYWANAGWNYDVRALDSVHLLPSPILT